MKANMAASIIIDSDCNTERDKDYKSLWSNKSYTWTTKNPHVSLNQLTSVFQQEIHNKSKQFSTVVITI